jgi:hypothetical protein
MRTLVILLLTAFQFQASGQAGNFPRDWLGTWKGQLQWFKTGTAKPQQVQMELRIAAGDSAGTYHWHLQYGAAGADSRPYLLKPVDAEKGHWVIDERNGIVLDQFWVGNRLCGAFTVQNNTIINSYQVEDGKLQVEFYSLPAKPLQSSGLGTDDSPKVDSYRVGSYQKALLERVK